jgi:hypothetical protein
VCLRAELLPKTGRFATEIRSGRGSGRSSAEALDRSIAGNPLNLYPAFASGLCDREVALRISPCRGAADMNEMHDWLAAANHLP